MPDLPKFWNSATWPGRWVERAACAGRAPLFDATLPGETGEDREARHWRAAETCRRCPVLSACRQWRAEQKPVHRSGVIAGTVRVGGRGPRPERNLLAPASGVT